MLTSPSHHYTITLNRTVVWLVVFGLILLLGIIFLSGNINQSLAAQPTPAAVITTAPVISSPQPTPNYLNDVQSILNHPANFRVVPTDISPVQAFAEGKTTKFLMGL